MVRLYSQALKDDRHLVFSYSFLSEGVVELVRSEDVSFPSLLYERISDVQTA